jgi:hypothetical protein
MMNDRESIKILECLRKKKFIWLISRMMLCQKKIGECYDEKLRVRFFLLENLIDWNFTSLKESMIISVGEFVISY